MMLKDDNSRGQERPSVVGKGEWPRAVWQPGEDHSHCLGTVHTSILVWIGSTFEANLLIPTYHALISIMEQRMNLIPPRRS